MGEISNELMIQLIVTLVGIFLGTMAAFAVDRYNEKSKKKKMAAIILRSLKKELTDNYDTLKSVSDAFVHTPWGKSFYVSTIAWETALSSGDLPDIIGFELTDIISNQYSHLYRTRYYVDLLTRLWFAPEDIPGYKQKREGFNTAIVESINKALNQHFGVVRAIDKR